MLMQKGDVGRILKKKVQITGEFIRTDEGVLISHDEIMMAGETKIVSFPHNIKFLHGNIAHVAVNPLLYTLGNVTGPAVLYKGSEKLFFRYEPDDDIDLSELDYVVKLVFTKDS